MNKYLQFIKNSPYKLGQRLGFNKLTEIHNEWLYKMIFNKNDTTLQAHRGSYKTTCLSIAIPLLMILRPSRPILFLRKTDSDVKEVVRQIVKILKTDEMKFLAKEIWGKKLVITTETQNELNLNLNTDVKGTNQLVAMGIGGSITGKHFDYIFTDDIVNISDRTSKAERDKTKFIYNELQNIKNRDGRIFNTGTPWHVDDCFSIMPEAVKYDCYTTGLMTDTDIANIKKQMLPSLFAANYELRHIASEDIIFENPKYTDNLHLVEQGDCHIDCAYGGEDYTAFTIIKKLDNKYYVFGKIWRKRIDEIKTQIIAYYKQYMSGKMYMELNADKGFSGKEMRVLGARVQDYYEKENKYIKIVTYLKKAWDNVYFTNNTDKEYIQQILDYNENAEHDDAPDSLASLLRILDGRQSNFSFE